MGANCSKVSTTVAPMLSDSTDGRRVVDAASGNNNSNSNQIEAEIRAAQLEAKKLVKILFLGVKLLKTIKLKVYRESRKLNFPGGPESGKSTLFKQVQILYLDGFTSAEMVSYASIIRANAVTALQQLIQAVADLGLAGELQGNSLEALAQFETHSLLSTTAMTPMIGSVLGILWQTEQVQAAYGRRHVFQLLDSCKYFLDDIERISGEEYVPTPQDVLYSRSQTLGVHEVTVPYRRLKLRMIDVGGQKAEQRKWIHQFEDVNAVLFVVDLSGYCAQGTEDMDTNRVVESLRIFERSINNKFLAKASVILFLNKVDLFQAYLKTIPLKDSFEDYSGADTLEEAGGFILQKMLDKISEDRDNYNHYTTAVDTENTKRIMKNTMDIIVQGAVNRLGFQ